MALSNDSGNDGQTLHILGPAADRSPNALAAEPSVKSGDLIADLQGFPASAWIVATGGACHDLTPELELPADYWTVARNWLRRVTADAATQ